MSTKINYPNTYAVWDLETSGLQPENSKILEIAVMEVKQGEIVSRNSWLLNHQMEISQETTDITGITKELIDTEGKDPMEAMEAFMDILQMYDAHVTHNGVKFDIPWLAHHTSKMLNRTVGDHKVFLAWLLRNSVDTAVIVKGGKLGMERNWNENFVEYAERVMGVFAKGVKYNLGLCVEELGIDKGDLVQHRASADVELTNRVYQKLVHETNLEKGN